ncbi:MAG: VanZ family protein [Betaproteobacteria bacterium]
MNAEPDSPGAEPADARLRAGAGLAANAQRASLETHAGDVRTRLPHVLAGVYALAIVFASLQPFGDWIAPPADAPFWLFSAGRVRAPSFDVIANLIAYLPFGAFVALIPRRAAPALRIAIGTAAGFALSLAIESLQAWIPPRDANVVDLVSNTLGALAGASIAATIARRPGARATLSRWRRHLFLSGVLGDVGLVLLALWLAAQLNPAIPLFAIAFDPAPERVFAASLPESDAAAIVIEAAESAFQVLGVGLFLALLVRHRRHVGAAVLLLIGAALVLKGLAAILLLKPAAWDGWLRPGISTGIAVGALALLAAIVLPRPAMIALCGIALLSSLMTPLVASDLLAARAPLTLFNWRYGHLLNFNGLTHTALLLWPVAAAAWLFALSGRPAWGAPQGMSPR